MHIFKVTLLMVASKLGHLDVVRYLLKHGADVNTAATQGRRQGTTSLHLAAGAGHVEVARLLLRAGGGVNTKECHGRTPLITAAGHGRMATVRLLLEVAADLTVFTKKGATGLCKAAEHGHCEVVEQLLNCGAPSGPSEGCSPGGKTHLMTPLCQAIGGATPESGVIQLLLERGSAQQFQGEIGRRALLLSVKKDYAFAVADMVGKQSMDPNARTDHGWTLLQIAAHLGHLDTADVLLRHKADPNKSDKHGRTALHVCTTGEVTNLLLQFGANICAKDVSGRTPLVCACKHG